MLSYIDLWAAVYVDSDDNLASSCQCSFGMHLGQNCASKAVGHLLLDWLQFRATGLGDTCYVDQAVIVYLPQGLLCRLLWQ